MPGSDADDDARLEPLTAAGDGDAGTPMTAVLSSGGPGSPVHALVKQRDRERRRDEEGDDARE